MRRMEAGDFDVRLPVETQDELGALATGFNRMAGHLSDLYRTLERRVADKTRSLADKNEELATLYEVAALLAEPGSTEELCREFLRKLGARLGAGAGAVRLIQAETGKLHLYAQEALPADFVAAERCLERGECLCGEAAQRQRGGVYPLKRHIAGEEAYRCARIGFATVGVFPIRFGTQQLGVFNLYFHEPREFTPAQRQMLETMGQHWDKGEPRHPAREGDGDLLRAELLAQELRDSIAQSLAFLNLVGVNARGSSCMARSSGRSTELADPRGDPGEPRRRARALVHVRTRLAQADIESAIASTLERFEGQTGIRATFVQSGSAMPLSPEIQIQVMHIIQECLSNARAYRRACAMEMLA
jgi:two-component system nitrate/nitrite sensor histidine kinase NarX